jgi:alpha-galactosidase
MPTLENSWLQLSIEPSGASWILQDKLEENLCIKNVHMHATYRRGSSKFRVASDWQSARIDRREMDSSPHGPLHLLEISLNPDGNGVQCTLTFALPEDFPLLLWKLRLENRGDQPLNIERLEMLNVDSRSGGAIFAYPPRSPAFFSNGWQSWSYTGVYGAADRFHHTRLGPLREPTDYNAGTPQPSRTGHFSSDMFGVLGDRVSRLAVVAGFLSQQQHFGSLEAKIHGDHLSLRMWANGDAALLYPGARVETDWACLQFINIDHLDPLGDYMDAVARQNDLPGSSLSKRPTPVGWCSWYQFSSEQFTGTITPDSLEDNLLALHQLQPRLPLKLFQIDDGYQAQIGDWGDFSTGFPQGVATLAEKALSLGLTPGLWLAPFIVHPKSRLAAEHPDWLLKGRFGRHANAGLFWDSFVTAMDVTHPEALAYASEAIRRAVHDWKFPYIKLDFLYAAALPGKYHDPTRTRAQALHAGLQALRQAAGEQAFLLGCGCPLGPAIGLVDAMRIGPDTFRGWYPSYQGIQKFFRQEPNFPSTYNSCRNAIARSAMHRRWWINDPDCLLLRESTSLSLAEVQTVATVIALSGGSLLLSDDLPALPPERLRIAETMLPLIGRAPQVLEWFDLDTPSRLRLDLENTSGAWHLLALINWDDEPQEITVNLREFGLNPEQSYFAREYWSQKSHRMTRGKLLRERLPAHGSLLLSVRPLLHNQPQYLGGDLHISQGLEVAGWKISPRRVELKLERPGEARGSIFLSLPAPPKKAFLSKEECKWQVVQEGVYRFPLEIQPKATLRLHR